MDWPIVLLISVLMVAISNVQANRCTIEDDTKTVCIQGIPKLIRDLEHYVNRELRASYKYQHMAQYHSRGDKAYHGFASFFSQQSEKASKNADVLREYFNKRAMALTFDKIEEPKTVKYPNLTYSVKEVLRHEQRLNKDMLLIHDLAAADPHLQYFIEENFLDQKVDIIKKMSDLHTILYRMDGNHLGEHVLDDRLGRGVWI